VPLDDRNRPLEVDLRAVASSKRRERRRVEFAARRELAKQLLEASRGDDLQDAGRLVASVPEGVPLPAGLEDEIAGVGHDLMVAQQRSHPALEHVAVFILAAVQVQRGGQDVRRQAVLDQREAAARVLAVDHEPVAGDAIWGQRQLPLRWAQHAWAGGGGQVLGHRSSCRSPVTAERCRPGG
jgi:hypothetical protein